jgi:DNA-binding NarL/FixJ family response regulator
LRPDNGGTRETLATIVLADDNHAMLAEVSNFLRYSFNIVASVSDGALAVKSVLDLQPDVAVLDIAMPVMTGIDAAREIKRLGLHTRIVFLSIQQDLDYLETAAEVGASYVLKSRMKSDLVPAIEKVLSGRLFVSPLAKS